MGVTEEEASQLGSYLEEMRSYNGTGQTIILGKTSSGYTVTFVVDDPDDPEVKAQAQEMEGILVVASDQKIAFPNDTLA